MTTDLEIKFNSGAGALLCTCDYIIAYGYDHTGKTYHCKKCDKTWEIGAQIDGGFEAILAVGVSKPGFGCPHCGYRHPPDGMCLS